MSSKIKFPDIWFACKSASCAFTISCALIGWPTGPPFCCVRNSTDGNTKGKSLPLKNLPNSPSFIPLGSLKVAPRIISLSDTKESLKAAIDAFSCSKAFITT